MSSDGGGGSPGRRLKGTYPFPDDEVLWASAYGSFEPGRDSYVAVARMPGERTAVVSGKEHTNTHRLVVYTPVRGPVAFQVNPEADAQALMFAAFVLEAESDHHGDGGEVSMWAPFVEKKTGVRVDISGGGQE